MTSVQEPKVEEPTPEPAPLVQTVADYPVPRKAYPDHHVAVPRRSHWFIWLLVLAALGAAAVWFGMRYYNAEKKGPAEKGKGAGGRAIPVTAATASKGNLNLYLPSIGTVTAFQTVTVRSRVDGELMKVNFSEGQVVHEGDPLVEIDPRMYQVQLAQAEGQLARDQATLNQARLDLERDKKLAASGFKAISQQQLDAQISTLGQYEGTVKTDQATIDNAKLQILYCNITAPISGRLGLRLIDKGNFVQASNLAGLAVITQLQPIAVIFTVPQDDIFRVQQKFNSGAEVVTEAWNKYFTTKLATGKLLAIDNQVDQTTGTVKLKAVFENKDNALFPNEFVNAKLLIDTRKDVVIVPSSAIQHGPTAGPNASFAYLVKSDETVEMRPVTVGPVEGDQTIVENGLSPGDKVVTEGTDKLQNGTKVDTRSSKAGGKKKQPANAGEQTPSPTKAADDTSRADSSSPVTDSSGVQPRKHTTKAGT